MMAFSFGVGGRVLLIITHLLFIWTDYTLAQGDQGASQGPSTDNGQTIDNKPTIPPPPISSNEKNGFIEPIAITPNVEVVPYKDKEYLLVDIKVMHDFAVMMCPSYFGATIATIPDINVAQELSDALAETSLEFESLWIGGKNSSAGSWNWIKNNYSEVISDEIINLIGNTDAAADLERHCLAFAREHHQKPQFKHLDCFVNRPFMCERPRGSSEGNQTTHPGWILIGARLYKIFNDKVDFHTAGMNCFTANPNATLAILDNANDVKQLARYLLIGRPSLENAWIGARWLRDKYEFEGDASVMLPNTTNQTTGFPPWRNNEMQKPGGCVLLDRHLTDTPLFVETRCARLRSYICSRPSFNISIQSNHSVTHFEDRLYHAYYHALPWHEATLTCQRDKGILAEPTNDTLIQELLYVMGQNVTTFDHIWLGARYSPVTLWKWQSTDTQIDTNVFPFLKNNTYVDLVENMNTCLNMDRENHVVGMFYGTNCFYPQNFICMLDRATTKNTNE